MTSAQPSLRLYDLVVIDDLADTVAVASDRTDVDTFLRIHGDGVWMNKIFLGETGPLHSLSRPRSFPPYVPLRTCRQQSNRDKPNGVPVTLQ